MRKTGILFVRFRLVDPRRVVKLVLAIPFGWALVACGGTPGNPVNPGTPGGATGTISGKVAGPNGSDVNGTVIAAFVCNNSCTQDSDLTQTIAGQANIASSGSSSAYQIGNVPSGKYIVLALKDTNQDGQAGVGDLLGVFDKPVTPPSNNINIQMQTITETAGAALITTATQLVNADQ